MNVDIAELDDRINKCQKILDSDPNSQIFAALAEAYRKKKMVDKALEVCRKGLEIHPSYASAYIVMSKIFVDRSDFEKADSFLKKAIEVGGRTRSVDILQSEIFIRLGQKEKARSLLDKLHKSDPLNESVKRLLVSVDEVEKPIAEDLKMPGPELTIQSAAQMTSQIKKSYTLSNALTIIKTLPRVLGVVAVSRDGIVVEGHFDGMLTGGEMGALASAAFDTVVQGVAKIDLGVPKEIMVETENSKLWILGFGGLLIIISMRDDVNFGSLKLKVTEIFKNTVM